MRERCPHCRRLMPTRTRQRRSFADTKLPDGFIDRFWARVDKSGGPNACWPWVGHRNRQGYGSLYVGLGYDSFQWIASRFAYAVTHDDPGDLMVLHNCDNPPCCNPTHLRVGTNADNVRDRTARGRSLGHPAPFGENHCHAILTEENVREIRRLRHEEGLGRLKLAARFGVSGGAIQHLLDGRTWRHVR